MQFTGKIGDVIDISGNSFSRISRVLFSDAKSNFNVINDTLIRARVPNEVAWDYIKIISDERSATGISSQKFAPEPFIEEYYLTSGIYGDTISITGKAFSGVSGVTFNGIEASYSVQDNNYLEATVPSGDTRGSVRVYGQSGLTYTALQDFEPEISVTGFSPTSGITGTSINIYGKYFFDELMYTGDQSGKYLVSYGKNIYSGYVEKISDTHLSGKIPAKLVDGPISVAKNNSVEGAVEYYVRSDDDFDVLALGLPRITAASTITGFYSSYYGNQPIVFYTKNIGTDKNGKGLSLGLLASSVTGSFLNGASGLGEITESSYASPSHTGFAWIIDGSPSPQATLSPDIFGEEGQFAFFVEPYPPGTALSEDINEPFVVSTFVADPEMEDQEDFQVFMTPTESALVPGDYYVIGHLQHIEGMDNKHFGLEQSRIVSSQKVKILPKMAIKNTGDKYTGWTKSTVAGITGPDSKWKNFG